jgi:hypothetical protein
MDNTQEEILKLRKRVHDLTALGYMTRESAGTYEQTILQTWQEADRRRQTLMGQAETLRRQAAAAEAQAGAYTTMASILYNIVNKFVEAGQKRLQEETERKAEREAHAESAPNGEPSLYVVPTVEAPSPPKRGRPKKE